MEDALKNIKSCQKHFCDMSIGKINMNNIELRNITHIVELDIIQEYNFLKKR
jgi:hypothetical protein